MAMPIQQVSQHVCIYANQPEPLTNADMNQISPENNNTTNSETQIIPPREENKETTYVGDECVFLLMPDGQISCVAGIENLILDSDLNNEEIINNVQYSRLECFSCHQVLEYDNRAAFIQCSGCNTLNAAPQNNNIQETDNPVSSSGVGGRVMIVICGRCNTRNISRLGSIYVECWLCNAICQVDYPVERTIANTVLSRRQRIYTFMSQRISSRFSIHNNNRSPSRDMNTMSSHRINLNHTNINNTNLNHTNINNTSLNHTNINNTNLNHSAINNQNSITDSNNDPHRERASTDSIRENSNLRFRVNVRLKERMRRVMSHRRNV